MPQDQRKTVIAERLFRGANIWLIGPDMDPAKPETLDNLGETVELMAIHIGGIAAGLEKCAGALRDIYECVSRIEANQKAGRAGVPGSAGAGRFPSIP